MATLETKYLGMFLKNPIVIGSSGFTGSVKEIIELEQAGAGAVVLKSIFEEEILMEYDHLVKNSNDPLGSMDEHFDYLDLKIKQDNVTKYLDFIKEVKSKVKIPVIASVNCASAHEWAFFAKKIAESGADALEINAFIMPSDLEKTGVEIEKMYMDIIESVRNTTDLPVSFKISHYFSNLAHSIRKFSETGIYGITLFNRFYSPDFDINTRKLLSTNVFSNPAEISEPLRWVSLMSNRVSCDLAASTGIHNGESLIKILLAGADAAQIVSTVYKNGKGVIAEMLQDLEKWMDDNGYETINDFKGMLSQARSKEPALYERVQFMKYFSDME